LWLVSFIKNLFVLNLFFLKEILVYYMGVKCGYSSPQTLTDQSTAIKRGQKGDLQVLRPHVMSCVPV
jgi:long-chain acyl-CoA synthetase